MDMNNSFHAMTMEDLVKHLTESRARLIGVLVAEETGTGFFFGPEIMALMNEEGGAKRMAITFRTVADKIEHELGTSRPKG